MIREFFWRWGLAAARVLSRWISERRRHRWARSIGFFLGRVSTGYRAAVRANLDVISAFSGRSYSTDAVFSQFALMLSDFLADAHPQVPVEGLARAEEARKRGKGVLFLTSHLGHWELGGKILAGLGWDVTAVYQPYRSKALQAFIQGRRAMGLAYLPVGKGAASGVGRVLDRGGAVAEFRVRAGDMDLDFLNRRRWLLRRRLAIDGTLYVDTVYGNIGRRIPVAGGEDTGRSEKRARLIVAQYGIL